MDGVIKKAADLGMTSDLGPEIEGYQHGKNYTDLEPEAEVEVSIADLIEELDVNNA